MPEFTTSWFSQSALRPWTKKLLPLAEFPIFWGEIGCFQGQSAYWALENVLLHPHSKMWICDPWLTTRKIDEEGMEANYQLALKNLKPWIDSGKVTIYRDKSTDRIPRFPNELLDFLYVDGDHLYDGVKFDIEVGWTKLRPGGLMCMDDYRARRNTDGVARAVNEIFFGVNLDGTVGKPQLESDLFYETSRAICVRKPVKPGDTNVSAIAEYTAANLHDREPDGPYVYARPGTSSPA